MTLADRIDHLLRKANLARLIGNDLEADMWMALIRYEVER